MRLNGSKTVVCALAIVTLALAPAISSAQMRSVPQEEQAERERKRKEDKQRLAEAQAAQAAADKPAAEPGPGDAQPQGECLPDGTARKLSVDVNTLEDIFAMTGIDAAALMSSAQPKKADDVQWRPVPAEGELAAGSD